jgi:hypothetical protein
MSGDNNHPAPEKLLTEEQLSQLRRLAVNLFGIYCTGIAVHAYQEVLGAAVRGFSERHNLALKLVEVSVGAVLSRLYKSDWFSITINRGGRYVSGSMLDQAHVENDEAILNFVRDGLGRTPMEKN